ncbi:hypothetical protein ACQCN2_03555 [Brevibacillus ginsengisoli]|uniref:hypothetical protein n=1 Tax=Brevibacillus ginsengisoli TaxID=363854 RepID=UPI003CF0C80B
MKNELREAIKSIEQINIELRENNIRLRKLGEEMGVVFDEHKEIKTDLQIIIEKLVHNEERLDSMLQRYEEKDFLALKAVQ